MWPAASWAGPGSRLVAVHSTRFFKLVASGPCLAPHHELTACQERPHRSLGQHVAQLGPAGPSFVKL